MTFDDHATNWANWANQLPGLDAPKQPGCGSIESSYASPRNAGWGNAEMGETPYDLQMLQRIKFDVVDVKAAECFDRSLLTLPVETYQAVKIKYLENGVANGRVPSKGWSRRKTERLLHQAEDLMMPKLQKAGF